MKKLFILTIILSSFYACTDLSVLTNQQTAKEEVKILKSMEVENREFIITSPEYKSKKITLGFLNGRIFGFSGVNRYFAEYKIKNNKLVLDYLGSTKMAADNDSMRSELIYLDILKDNREIKIEGDKLILISNEGITLEFIDKNHKSEENK